MSKRIFADWLKTFRSSINGYDYYVDFDKICENARRFEIEINILNCLIGSNNIEEKFRFIVEQCPRCIKAIPILLAVRESKIYCQDENGAFTYDFENANYSIEQYIYISCARQDYLTCFKITSSEVFMITSQVLKQD